MKHLRESIYVQTPRVAKRRQALVIFGAQLRDPRSRLLQIHQRSLKSAADEDNSSVSLDSMRFSMMERHYPELRRLKKYCR